MNKKPKENILYFEGAGWEKVDSNDVGNIRIRTRIKNNNNRLIYIEITKSVKKGFYVDHCFYDDKIEDKINNHSIGLSKQMQRSYEKEYTKKNILDLINNNLNCTFKDLIVINNHDIVLLHNSKVHSTDKPLAISKKKQGE